MFSCHSTVSFSILHLPSARSVRSFYRHELSLKFLYSARLGLAHPFVEISKNRLLVKDLENWGGAEGLGLGSGGEVLRNSSHILMICLFVLTLKFG